MAGPTIITSFITNGGIEEPISRSSRPSPRRSPCCMSIQPLSPNSGSGKPVSASSETRKKPGVIVRTRRLSPSRQKATPRPEPLRGALSKRSPSWARHCHRSCPVVASMATMSRCAPIVVYNTPSISSGVKVALNSACDPNMPVGRRQAICRELAFSALIWSSGE